MEYKDIRDTLDTGDIVLFSGKGLFSRVIRTFSHSKWSHVGIVVRVPEYDMVLLWESTGLSKVKDVSSGKSHKGVQTVSLSERINDYDGEISIRKFDGTATDAMKDKLRALRHAIKHRPYEEDYTELACSLIDLGPIGDNEEEDLSSVFCSELVAESLQEMGIMDDRLPSNEFIPKNFSENGRFEHYLTAGMSYGPELKIK